MDEQLRTLEQQINDHEARLNVIKRSLTAFATPSQIPKKLRDEQQHRTQELTKLRQELAELKKNLPPPSFGKRLIETLRDPFWQGIGVIVATLIAVAIWFVPDWGSFRAAVLQTTPTSAATTIPSATTIAPVAAAVVLTATPTVVVTDTVTPMPTETTVPTANSSETATETSVSTATDTPVATSTSTITEIPTPTDTVTLNPTDTVVPATPTDTSSPKATHIVTEALPPAANEAPMPTGTSLPEVAEFPYFTEITSPRGYEQVTYIFQRAETTSPKRAAQPTGTKVKVTIRSKGSEVLYEIYDLSGLWLGWIPCQYLLLTPYCPQ